MKNKNVFFNFKDINIKKRYSFNQIFFSIVLVIMFLSTPLSFISPETFVVPKSYVDVQLEKMYSCGCTPCYIFEKL